MNPDGRVEVGVRRSHDGRRRTAGRQTRNVDALRIYRIAPHDGAGDASDQRRFALASLLVARAEPVPTLCVVGSPRLLGIDDEAILLFGEKFIRVPAAKSSGDWVQPWSMTTRGSLCPRARLGMNSL